MPLGSEVVAIDLPGHGLSTHKSLDGPPCMLSEYVFYVSEAIEQLKWNNKNDKEQSAATTSSSDVVLIGHSLGASISCVYAAAFPEMVERLVLLDGLGPMARSGDEVSKHVRKHIQRRQKGLVHPMNVYQNIDEAIKARVHTPTTWPGKQWISQEAAEELVTRATKKANMNDDGVVFLHDQRLYWPSLQYFTTEQTEGIYKDIQCPTALIGAESGYPRDSDKFQKAIELMQPRVMKDLPGSHHFHADLDSAVAVSQEVINFILNVKTSTK